MTTSTRGRGPELRDWDDNIFWKKINLIFLKLSWRFLNLSQVEPASVDCQGHQTLRYFCVGFSINLVFFQKMSSSVFLTLSSSLCLSTLCPVRVFQNAAVGQKGGRAFDPAEREGGSSCNRGELLRPRQDRSAHSWRGVGCPAFPYCISWLLYFTIIE